MPKDEPSYILATRCEDLRVSPVRGTVRRPCIRCGEMCWVCPSLQNQKVDGVLCTRCLTDKERAEAKLILKEGVVREFLAAVADMRAVELKKFN